MNSNNTRFFENWEISIANNLVAKYKRKWKCLRHEDFDDLLQECLIHWLFVKDHYDRSKEASHMTYMSRIISNKLIDIIRSNVADKRKVAYLAYSLDKLTGNNQLHTSTTDFIPQIHLKLDLAKALLNLSTQQRELCKLIGEYEFSIKDASISLNIPRSTIYDMLKQIRATFIKAGLKNYL